LFAVFQNLKLYFFVEDYTVVGLLVLPFILQKCVRDLMTVDYADVLQSKKVDDLVVGKKRKFHQYWLLKGWWCFHW